MIIGFVRKFVVLFVLSVLLSGCSLTEMFRKSNTPRIAFVIDDAGYHNAYRNYVLAIDAPVTYAVLPFVDCTKSMANFFNRQGLEVILHMPMAAKNNLQNKEQNMIYPSMSEEKIKENIEACLAEVPFAVGFNNHKGSAFTENYEGMSNVLKIVKEKKLLFLDSLTGKESKAQLVADELNMEIGVRDVFLDNKKETVYIKNQIKSLVKTAKNTGSAIGIGHYNKETLKAIADSVAEIKKQGIEIVFLSELI